jgi:hypothetical protein
MHLEIELDLIGAPRAAEIIGVSLPTAHSYFRLGKIPTVVIEGRYYARRADVLTFRAQLPDPVPRRAARAHEIGGESIELKTAPSVDRQHKQIAASRLEVKADNAGNFVALVYLCTGLADLDGDLIGPQAFRAGDDAVVSAWNHSAAMGSALPAGRGLVKVDGNRILVAGQFNLASTVGRDTYETVKQLGDRCEWSIGYSVKAWRVPTPQEEAAGVDRVITALEIFEVSPVVKGAAGPGRSGTVDLKSAALTEEAVKLVGELNALHVKYHDMLVANETKARNVGTAARVEALRGARQAAIVLTQGYNAKPPVVRFFSTAFGREEKMLGMFFTPYPNEIWVCAGLDAKEAFHTAAHEVFHALRPQASEADTTYFGQLFSALDEIDAEVLIGHPHKTAPPDAEAITLLVSPGLRAFRSERYDEDGPRVHGKLWRVTTGRVINPSDDHGQRLGLREETVEMYWREIALLA